jgi:hypothetical protein
MAGFLRALHERPLLSKLLMAQQVRHSSSYQTLIAGSILRFSFGTQWADSVPEPAGNLGQQVCDLVFINTEARRPIGVPQKLHGGWIALLASAF